MYQNTSTTGLFAADILKDFIAQEVNSYTYIHLFFMYSYYFYYYKFKCIETFYMVLKKQGHHQYQVQ